MRYTGKQRDSESNLDDFGARYYASQMGRFLSVDWSAVPAPVPYANLTNPQTLNLYIIVRDRRVAQVNCGFGVAGAPCSVCERGEFHRFL